MTHHNPFLTLPLIFIDEPQNGPVETGDTSDVQLTLGFRAHLFYFGKKTPC